MLGFEVAQSPVSKFIMRVGGRVEAIAAIDMCVVPTLTFDRQFAVLVQGYGPRQLVWFEATRYLTAKLLVQQIPEAFS